MKEITQFLVALIKSPHTRDRERERERGIDRFGHMTSFEQSTLTRERWLDTHAHRTGSLAADISQQERCHGRVPSVEEQKEKSEDGLR